MKPALNLLLLGLFLCSATSPAWAESTKWVGTTTGYGVMHSAIGIRSFQDCQVHPIDLTRFPAAQKQYLRSIADRHVNLLVTESRQDYGPYTAITAFTPSNRRGDAQQACLTPIGNAQAIGVIQPDTVDYGGNGGGGFSILRDDGKRLTFRFIYGPDKDPDFTQARGCISVEPGESKACRVRVDYKILADGPETRLVP